MGSTHPPLSHDDYTVGWICALALEMAAAVAILDERHSNLPQSLSDHNNYQPGRIGEHNVIIACLPAGVTGTTSAATVAAQMLSTFKFIRFGLMVGIGGGVPSKERDIRLGDVVVSEPTSTFGGVVQYDFGKTTQEGRFIHTGSLDKPPAVLLTAVAKLKAIHMMEGNKLTRTISEMWTKYPKMGVNFVHQGAQHDRLFEADYDHAGTTASCEQCDAARLLDRPVRSLDQPRIYYGLIASGNQVMSHGITRDLLSREFGILCFETEAAGLMDNFPCLVIRGICDYADSHKSKRWQEYAAAVAAAYAKELLYVIPKAQVVNVSLATQTAVYSRDFDSSGVPTVLGSTFTSGGGGHIDMEKVVGLTISQL
jgi:nucleoside phosphorylase